MKTWQSMRNIGRKSIRYLRRVSQIAFFLLIVVAGGWIFFGGYTCTLLMPVQELWLSCPLGALQSTLSYRMLLTLIIVPAVIFVIVTIMLGRVFCSWVCPIGAIVEFINVGFERLKFTPVFERIKVGAQGLRRIGFIKNGLNIATPTLVALSAYASKNAVFCFTLCPIGSVCRGAMAPLEQMAMIPIAAGLSLGERKLWCKYLCPVGAVLTAISALNPFIKPKVKEEKCRTKGCLEDCEDYSYDYCAICRLIECGSPDPRCREICPEDIDLLNSESYINGSLLRCNKCLDCYVGCDQDAMRIRLASKPAILRPFIRLYDSIRRRAPS